MLKSYIYFICNLISVTCLGQNYFNLLLGLQQPFAEIASAPAIEVNGEGYIIPYISWNYQFGEKELIIQKLNYNGNNLWEKKYGKQDIQYDVNCFIKSIDNRYVMSGSYFNINDSAMYFYLLKIDSFGDSVWSKKYSPITKARVVNSTKVIETSNKGFILCGARQPYDKFGNALPADIFIVRTDSMGNKLWAKQYGGSGHEVATSIIELSDKSYLVGGYQNINLGPNSTNTYIFKIDSLGVFLWEKSYDEGNNDAAGGMIELKDGNFLLIGESVRNIPTPVIGQAFLLKISPSGTVIWDNKFGGVEFSSFTKAIELPNGNLIAAGGNNNTSKLNQAGWLLKSSAIGDSLWSKIYDFIPGMPSIFNGISATSDDGFILTGSAIDTTVNNSTQQAWVLKVDSSGCYQSNCQFVGIKEELKYNPYKIFPNPSSGKFEIKSEFLIESCSIIDVLGKVIFRIKNNNSTSIYINLTEFENGFYFIKIINKQNEEHIVKISLNK